MGQKTRIKWSGRGALVACFAVVIAGCSHGRDRELRLTSCPDGALSASGNTGAGHNRFDNSGNSDGRVFLFAPVYFERDSDALRDDALTTLKGHADAVKNAVPGTYVLVEGHCDERGTQEYNMALGDRRAQAVRDYLVRLGVPPDRLAIVTYGEEDPAYGEHNEKAWARNRRCEFVATPTPPEPMRRAAL